jgi:DNA-binding transcriptional ArsR family regulator
MAEERYSELLKVLSSTKRRAALSELRQRALGLSELASLLGSHNLPNVQRDILEPLLALGLIEALEDPRNPRRRLYRATAQGVLVLDYLERGARLLEGLPPGASPAPGQRGARGGIGGWLLMNAGYLMAWGLFAGSLLGAARGVSPSWVPFAWLIIALLASALWKLFKARVLARLLSRQRKMRLS